MLDAPVEYNEVALNTVSIEGLPPGVREGCLLEEFDYGRSQGVGYTEKRSQDDGLDASDVFMGARYISLAGTVYGSTPADLFDRLQRLRTAMTPTIAYEQDVPNHGYLPLTFSLPTLDSRFVTGIEDTFVRELEFRARPIGQPQFTVRRDTGGFSGGGMQPDSVAGEKGGAIGWRATLECKDPRMYVRPDIWVPFITPPPGAPIVGNIVNRGDYPAPLNILLGVVSSGGDSTIEVNVGGSNVVIKLPSLINAVVRYSGDLKVLTVETSGSNFDTLRMDLLSFTTDKRHPKVQPGSGTYSIKQTGAYVNLSAGTRLMYSESFA